MAASLQACAVLLMTVVMSLCPTKYTRFWSLYGFAVSVPPHTPAEPSPGAAQTAAHGCAPGTTSTTAPACQEMTSWPHIYLGGAIRATLKCWAIHLL